MSVKSNTSMTIRINNELKKEAQGIFESLGMDMTTAINVFLRQAVYHNGFPFEIKLKEPNEVTYAAMEDAENGKDMYGPFDSVEALTEEVND